MALQILGQGKVPWLILLLLFAILTHSIIFSLWWTRQTLPLQTSLKHTNHSICCLTCSHMIDPMCGYLFSHANNFVCRVSILFRASYTIFYFLNSCYIDIITSWHFLVMWIKICCILSCNHVRLVRYQYPNPRIYIKKKGELSLVLFVVQWGL